MVSSSRLHLRATSDTSVRAAETSVPNAKAYSVDIKSNTAVEDFLDAHPAYPAAVIYQDGKLQKIFEGLDGEKTKQMLSYLQN